MQFVVNKNIPLAEQAFGPLGDVTLLSTADTTPAAVRDADVLIVRSETKVNSALLEGSRVRFVGTTTIGTDHIDIGYLNEKGIAFASAPGCNSNSVKEYVVTALLYLANRKGFSLKGKTLGVIGVGNVGSKVVRAAQALGMTVLQNDPPLARATGEKRFVPIDDLMDADFITLHVPLTRSGPDETCHLFDDGRFSRLKPGAIVLNTSRGAVVDTAALNQAITGGRLAATVLDVWEHEPLIDPELVRRASLATPHIAGYSFEGKLNGLTMIRDAVCRHFGLTSDWNPSEEIAGRSNNECFLRAGNVSDEEYLYRIAKTAYDIEYDHQQLQKYPGLPAAQRGEYFRNLRSTYRVRREFMNLTVHLSQQETHLQAVISTLGFHCVVD